MSTNGDDDGKNNGDNTTQQTDDIDMQPSSRIRIYPPTHNGPYNVYIRANRNEPLRHLKLSKYLFQTYGREKVSRAVLMNNHKMRVELKSADEANNLVKDNNSLLSLYRVYIAAEQVEVDGIIRFSCDEPLEDLIKYGRGQFEDLSAPEVEINDTFRFEKLVRDTNGTVTEKNPTAVVRVTFPGSVLPSKVVIDGLIIPVQMYLRKAMVCENCFRTGHTQKYCVLKPKCSKCGSNEHSSVTCSSSASTKCFICGLEHDPNNRSLCPKISEANRRQQEQSRKRMKLAYAEVLKQEIPTKNSFDVLSSDDDMDTDCKQPTQPVHSRQMETSKKRKISQPSSSTLTYTPINEHVTTVPRRKTPSKESTWNNGCGFPRPSSMHN